MRLIHCHRALHPSNMQRLLELLKTADSCCLVLREKAQINCADTEIMNQLNHQAKVYVLSNLEADKIPNPLNPKVISNQQFVELCIEAQQVIGWY